MIYYVLATFTQTFSCQLRVVRRYQCARDGHYSFGFLPLLPKNFANYDYQPDTKIPAN